MRLTKIFLYILPSVLLANAFLNGAKRNTVLVCYGKLKPESIKGYGYVILEPKHYASADVKKIRSQNDKVFAYMSLGEVNEHAEHYPLLKNYTLGKNEIWNSYYLNLKNPKTAAIITSLISKLFATGYDGIFLDNIDNFTSFGPQKDQKNELVGLLRSLHQKFPGKMFLQNAGLDLVSETAGFIDGIAVESVATSYDFKQKRYQLRDSIQSMAMMSRVKAVKETHKLPVILIEYAQTKKLRNEILKRIDTSSFPYFIGNINLQGIPEFKN